MSHHAVSLVKSRTFGSTTRKSVALVLADYADAAWSTFVGQATLAFESEVGERTVRRILSDFESEGLIRRHRRVGPGGFRTSDRIEIVRPAVEALPARLAGNDSPTGLPANEADLPATGARLPATDDSPTGHSLAGEPSTEPSEGTVREEPLVGLTLVEAKPDPVTAVFEAWKQATGRTDRVVLDSKRTATIKKALKDYPLDDVLDAVRGLAASPWHMGENPDGKRYTDVGNALGDAGRIEKFRDMHRDPPKRRKPAHRNLIPEGDSYTGPVAL